MWNKKGFTLIEIIIAMAILGIVAVSVLAGFSNFYSMMVATKNFTEEAFQAQQNIELQIQEIKNQVLAGNTPLGRQSYTLFEGTANQRTVQGYPRAALIGSSGVIHTIVADFRMPVFQVATISNVGIDLWRGSSKVSHAYASTPSLNIRSRTPVITDPNNVNLMNLHKWYVSREGFNIPMIENPEEPEIGVKYPRFPDDYIIIPNEISSNLNNILSSYRGRHILYTITPAAKSGKMGATVPSNPIFISGLPIINGLMLHLDASYINKEDSNQVRVITPDEVFSKKWLDLSPSSHDAVQNLNDSQPRLKELEYNANQWGKSLIGNYGASMSTGSFSPNNTTNLSVVISAKIKQNHGGSPHNLIIDGGSGSWGFGWADSGSLSYYLRNETGDDYYATQSKIPDYDWHVFTGIITEDSLTFRIDGNEVVIPIDSSVSPINIGPVKINWYSQLEIGEILIYDRDISGQDLESVEEYLYNKYNPTAEAVTILSLNNMNQKIIKGEVFTMPSRVTANMSNGTVQDVLVTWNPSTIETSTQGIKTSQGVAVLDETKTMTLTVNVLSIMSLDNIINTVYLNSPYLMPSVWATMSDGSKKNVSVTWNPSTIDTSTLESKTSVGTAVLDSTKTMTLRVNVVPKPVSGVTLNKAATNLPIGGNETLVANVNPPDASNKNVAWSSSNPYVATVNNSGTVTAHNQGTAIITVITEDGGFTDTCTITVNNPLKATSISNGSNVRRQFSLTFNKNIQSTTSPQGSINYINHNVVTFTRSSDFSHNTDLHLTVISADGETSTITVRLNRTGFIFYQYNWSIVNQTNN